MIGRPIRADNAKAAQVSSVRSTGYAKYTNAFWLDM
jgi:hypothetical protein